MSFSCHFLSVSSSFSGKFIRGKYASVWGKNQFINHVLKSHSSRVAFLSRNESSRPMSHFGSRAVRIPDESRLSHELEPQMEHRTRIPHLDILLGACLAT